MDFFSEFGAIHNIQQLLDQVRDLLVDRRIDSVYLRGQAYYDWRLRPTIGRPLEFLNRRTKGYSADCEDYLLNRFRRYSWGIIGRELGENELLLLARHHGIPVRLLDWSSNPLVALYFACADENKLQEPGAIWLCVRKQLTHSHYYDFFRDPTPMLKLKGVRFIYAPHVSPRVAAQSCTFTIQDSPDRDLDAYDPSVQQDDDWEIQGFVKLKVPPERKIDFILDLERLGITERAMFPDLDGIARAIIRTEVLREGK